MVIIMFELLIIICIGAVGGGPGRKIHAEGSGQPEGVCIPIRPE